MPKGWMTEFCKGLESRLLETVRWSVSTGVAFPQKSESILAHHFFEMQNVKCRMQNYRTRKRLTEVPMKIEASLSLLEKKLKDAP